MYPLGQDSMTGYGFLEWSPSVAREVSLMRGVDSTYFCVYEQYMYVCIYVHKCSVCLYACMPEDSIGSPYRWL